MKRKSMLFTVLLSLITNAVVAAVPPMINYQGKLRQPDGTAVVDSTYDVQFSIYDVSTGGTPLWSETQSIQVNGGKFATLIGSAINLPANIFDSQNRYFSIGIKDGSNYVELSPRQQIASVAFAFKAAAADTATTVSDGAISTSKIANAAVTSAKLATDLSITGALQVGSLTGPWINNNGRFIRLGDIQIAWGEYGSGGPSPITIPLPAPFLGTDYALTTTASDWPFEVLVADWRSKQTTSFMVRKYNQNGTEFTGPFGQFCWIAIGKWR